MRSPIFRIGALCVMITVVVPKSRVHPLEDIEDEPAVVKSSAPVGSSHKSTSGRFATARANRDALLLTARELRRKWSNRSPSPTSTSASSGSIGSSRCP
jgi:hypothetical protein